MLPAVFVLAMLAAACGSSGGGSDTTPPQTSSAPPATTSAPATSSSSSGGEVTINMEDFSFDPATVTASTSQDIVLVNNGQSLHNFSIKGTPIDQDVDPGQTVTLPAPGPSFTPGSYDFFCKYHEAQGMVGTLNATG